MGIPKLLEQFLEDFDHVRVLKSIRRKFSAQSFNIFLQANNMTFCKMLRFTWKSVQQLPKIKGGGGV